MAHTIEQLKREIEGLEKQLSTQHFGGLFDRKRIEQLEDKLKKKRKELARLQSGEDNDELDAGSDHIEIPEFASALESTPDLGPDFPLDIDADEPPMRKLPAKPPAKPSAKPAATPAKSVAKAVKKTVAKPKPSAKAKPKAKPAPKKKAAAKPAKKKSKR